MAVINIFLPRTATGSGMKYLHNEKN